LALLDVSPQPGIVQAKLVELKPNTDELLSGLDRWSSRDTFRYDPGSVPLVYPPKSRPARKVRSPEVKRMQKTFLRSTNIIPVLILASVLPSQAIGFDPNRLDQVKLTKQCPTCDLSEANLSEADLQGANLQGAILTGIDLEKADLRQADLRRADLSLSFFWGSTSEVGLLANGGGANLRGANLQGANLQGANLIGADLEGANLSEANLLGANLRHANLKDASLEGAKLQEAELCNTIMPDGKKDQAGCP